MLFPAFAAILFLTRPERAPHQAGSVTEAIAALQQPFGMPLITFVAAVLLVMMANGGWTAGQRAYLGRVGAILSILALASFIPVSLLVWAHAGPLSFLPATLLFLLAAIHTAIWVAIFSACARWRHGAILGAALWITFSLAVPYGTMILDVGTSFADALTPAAFVLTFLSPDGVAQGLRETLFPATFEYRWIPMRELYPIAYSLPVYALAAAAWIGIPSAIAMRSARPLQPIG